MERGNVHIMYRHILLKISLQVTLVTTKTAVNHTFPRLRLLCTKLPMDNKQVRTLIKARNLCPCTGPLYLNTLTVSMPRNPKALHLKKVVSWAALALFPSIQPWMGHSLVTRASSIKIKLTNGKESLPLSRPYTEQTDVTRLLSMELESTITT